MIASVQRITAKSHFERLIDSYGVFVYNLPRADFRLERENRPSETIYSLSSTFVLDRFSIQTSLTVHLPSQRLCVTLVVQDTQEGSQVVPYSSMVLPEHHATSFLNRGFMENEIKRAMKVLVPTMTEYSFRSLPFPKQTHDFKEVVKDLQLIANKRGYLTFHLLNFTDKPSWLELGVGTPLGQVTSHLKGSVESPSLINGIGFFGVSTRLPYHELKDDRALVTILRDYAKIIAEPRREGLLDL